VQRGLVDAQLADVVQPAGVAEGLQAGSM